MSLDVYGILVVGEIIYQKEISRNVKKYNEDTGIPYNVMVTEKYWVFADGSKIDFEHCSFNVNEDVFNNYDEDIGVIGFPLDGKTCLRGKAEKHVVEINQSHLDYLKEEYFRKYKRVPRLINFLEYG